MTEYINNTPIFSDVLIITEISDPAHADILNKAPIQIFQNTLYNRGLIEQLNLNVMSTKHYDPEASYQAGEHCLYENMLYKCVQETTGEWNAICWQQASALGEIEDLKKNIDNFIGDADKLSFAEGIEADNVVDAINEVFQSGNEKKGKLVENLVAMGIEASTDETWESLLNKVLDMTDTSGDTVTADTLLSGYTAHNATGEQITGVMPDRRSTTVTAAAVTQDDDYTYLSLPEGEACYSGGSKVRVLNSDLTYKLHITEISVETYDATQLDRGSASTTLDVQHFTKMAIGSCEGTTSVTSGDVVLLPENGIYNLTGIDTIKFRVASNKYESGVTADPGGQFANWWQKSVIKDIYLY